MAYTVSQIIEARDPSVDASSARVQILIDLSSNLTGTIYGTERNTAVALLVLHMLAKESHGGAAGAINSEKEGDLSRSFHKSGENLGDLGSTSWGVELLALRKQFIMMPRNRMMV